MDDILRKTQELNCDKPALQVIVCDEEQEKAKAMWTLTAALSACNCC